MKKLFSSCLLLLVFHYCEAQKLEIKYYPTFHLNGRSVIMCNGDTCILQLDVFERRDTSRIWWSETKVVSAKYRNDIRRMFETANQLTSTEPNCFDGMLVIGVFESDTSYHKFVCNCPFEDLHRDFVKQTIKTIQKVLSNM